MRHPTRRNPSFDFDGMNENHKFNLRIQFLHMFAVTTKLRLQTGRAKISIFWFFLQQLLTALLVNLKIQDLPPAFQVLRKSTKERLKGGPSEMGLPTNVVALNKKKHSESKQRGSAA